MIQVYYLGSYNDQRKASSSVPRIWTRDQGRRNWAEVISVVGVTLWRDQAPKPSLNESQHTAAASNLCSVRLHYETLPTRPKQYGLAYRKLEGEAVAEIVAEIIGQRSITSNYVRLTSRHNDLHIELIIKYPNSLPAVQNMNLSNNLQLPIAQYIHFHGG